jgi:class 3 adenylate cyclase/tetratricopeptide (TPR) repeat protein
MKCPRCQQDNPAHVRFCLACAAHLTLPCTSCGTELPENARFCPQCGRVVSAGGHMAEKIFVPMSALEGERKQITVLFADLKGSMELLADRDPEEARKILDPILGLMMEAVHRYQGTVNQVMGDGVMALFGAPLAHEDHAVRACYAALDMQAVIRRYAERARRAHGLLIEIRVGLNSGEVVVRAIGSDLHMNYTAVGQTTHLAARMEQIATPGSIVITSDTLRLVEGYVRVRPFGPIPVKGLREPVAAYEVLGAGSARSRLEAVAAQGLTRFAGREAELEHLSRALEQARVGHGQVVAVVGEPGVGKSRLFYELVHSPRTRGWLVLESRSVSYRTATPYLPVVDLLKGYFKIHEQDNRAEIREKVVGTLVSLDVRLEPALSAFLILLDVPTEDPAWEALDPPLRRHQTLDALKRLLLRQSQIHPLLLVFEDLHWADFETQAFLDGLIEALPAARLLLLVNYRPEYETRWGMSTYHSQLRIDPLPPDRAEELLSTLLGEDPGLRQLTQFLVERTEGNPLFLEESVRTLVETGVLIGERGGYRLVSASPRIEVPTTVRAVLAARIDRLLPEDKAVLQSAAVVGKDVPFPVLEAIGELPEDALRRSLARLQAAELLDEARRFSGEHYTFKHALTHEVAYHTVLQERRRALHARIVAVIEDLYRNRLAEQIDQLAHHAFRGAMWKEAVGYLRRAGDKAMARAANREAVTRFGQALAALQNLGPSRDTITQDIDLRLSLRHAHLPLGHHAEILEHLGAAEAGARRIDDRFRLAQVLGNKSTFFFMAGGHRRALEAGQQALAIATELGAAPLEIETMWRLAIVHCALGDYPRAIALTRHCVGALESRRLQESRTGPNLTSVLVRVWLARCLAERGEFAEAVALAGDVPPVAEAVAHATACWGLGCVHLRRGDLRQAVGPLERALELCRDADLPLLFPHVASALGLAYALGGQHTDALGLLDRATADASTGFGDETLHWVYFGEVYLLTGRVEDARHAAARAVRLSQDREERGHAAWALRLLGEISMRGDPADESPEAHYRQAMALADDLGMRPLVAHCHLGLGRLHRRTGERARAREHLGHAVRMSRELGMRCRLAEIEAEMHELDGSS